MEKDQAHEVDATLHLGCSLYVGGVSGSSCYLVLHAAKMTQGMTQETHLEAQMLSSLRAHLVPLVASLVAPLVPPCCLVSCWTLELEETLALGEK